MGKTHLVLAALIATLAALAAPAAANGAPVLTSNGPQVVPGKEITATANNSTTRLETETGLGVLECESIMLNGEATKNSGTKIEAKGLAGSTTSGCSFEEVETATVENISIKSLATTTLEGETGTGSFEASYAAKIPGGAECKFSNLGKPGTFHYELGGDRLIVTRTNVTSSGCGESFLEGEVKLETKDGTPVSAS